MNFSRRFACAAGLAGALALGTVLASGEAAAGHRNHGGEAAAAGIIGLAAGAVLGSVLTAPQAPPPPAYYAPPPVRYAPPPPPRVYYAPPPPPPPVYYAPARAYAPWTPEWAAYCARKYRSFDPRSGTFITYRGEERFCEG
ncbi:BA14K family protein [Roseibium suaedae]|uniref:Lectin-like protein BA14k n=1 Tax=Roseibium suaedae TaxID=735517 RepID=A0A1M7BJ85_9HYPH|nr:BA14K family protein [Roseibium suaedae]SHL54973.1 BA14K-like protein [Roseibium suaedae]